MSNAQFAGGGVPMITVIMPALAIAFIPAVIIEARILGKRLHLDGRHAVRTSILANLVSSAVGIPITWLVLAAIEITSGAGAPRQAATFREQLTAAIIQAPWIVSAERGNWMVPAAALVLLVPFFLVAWRVETAVARVLLREVPRERVSRVVLLANAVTFGAAAVVAIGILLDRLA